MNNYANLEVLRTVSASLAELNDQVVFVGGAVVGLYTTDSAAAEQRFTEDIDVVVKVGTYAEFTTQVDERLRQLGFVNDITSTFIYRYKIHGLTVDVMPTDPDVLGFSNHWYKEGVAKAVFYPISEQQSIRIFSAPYFLATKFDAFNSFRRGRDPRWNSDFEDIIYLFDNRVELIHEIRESPESVRSYLRAEIAKLITSQTIHESISVHLESRTAVKRTDRILTIWQEIATL
ncbi:hypothetical protein GCM10028807_21280 [Spirosoma daeguense]